MTNAELRPTAMVAGGNAIARDEDGRVVFVTGGLPGERVAVEIVEARRDFSRARVVDVIDASPLRVLPPCPELANGCGACQWQHVTVAGQRELKADIVRDALRRQGRIEDPPLQPTVELPASAYRTSVRAAVVDGRAGYREGASHDVATVGSCLVAHPLVEELLVTGRYGTAREVVLRCGARTGERLAVPTPAATPIEVPPDTRREWFHEEVAGRRWRISARSFFQSRADGADALAALVLEAAEGRHGHAVDLFSGVGVFAGVLADRGWRVTAVEGSATATGDARVNLADSEVSVITSDVNAWNPVAADVVVADPSRVGLRKEGVDVIAATGAARVVLVSCDAAALGRDARLLASAGYSLTADTPVDMFPHTFHVEAVSVFDR
jgi:23S rRNA (uracil1939-C5)-methyltransferase